MNCRQVASIIPEVVRGRSSPKLSAAEALLHIDGCGQCRALLEQERSLAERLGILAAATELAAPDYVEERLRAAFNRPAALPLTKADRLVGMSPARLTLWAGSIAAAAFFLVIVFSFRAVAPKSKVERVTSEKGGLRPSETFSRKASPPAEHKIRSAGSSHQVPTAAGARGSPTGLRRASGNRVAARVSRPGGQNEPSTTLSAASPARRPGAQPQESEIATDFLSLGYDAASNAVDSGQLIRVKMPRSSLISFGLPMNIERAGEPIQADVLVGQDGRARAIRFVNFVRERN